jgi:hypothetical protein
VNTLRPAVIALLLAAAAMVPAARAEDVPAPPDSASGPLQFHPVDADSLDAEADEPPLVDEGEWLRAPIGDDLITDRDRWLAQHPRDDGELRFDYNRVDRLRLGFGWELQADDAMAPRVGARLEYAFDRERILYGVALEQPLVRPGRLALGVSMVRRTDHPDLQQVEDFENSLALLFGRQDYRDYFEREGAGAYLAWRVPDFSTVSVHARTDRYRSLALNPGTRSWFHRNRPLRDNPAIDEGEGHAVILRSERLEHRTRATRAGLYHWIDAERAGGGLGGDFTYTRLLADVRSVLRLSPATTLLLRGVAGTTPDGTLPAQKRFTLGGVDGLRAHATSGQRGDQVALGQAEYLLDLWQIGTRGRGPGLQAIAFVDVGRAWTSPDGRFDLDRQALACDGGFGLGTSDGDVRAYFAKDLQEPDSDFVVSLRLQRPF